MLLDSSSAMRSAELDVIENVCRFCSFERKNEESQRRLTDWARRDKSAPRRKVLNLIHFVCAPCVNINIWEIFKWSERRKKGESSAGKHQPSSDSPSEQEIPDSEANRQERDDPLSHKPRMSLSCSAHSRVAHYSRDISSHWLARDQNWSESSPSLVSRFGIYDTTKNLFSFCREYHNFLSPFKHFSPPATAACMAGEI